MIEQALINPNFAGRDGFKWFIGVVANTTPDRANRGKNEYGYRVQVRIIGHHPGLEIENKDLPWAHVLVPLNMGTGAGGAGVSMNARGGEVVIGFFADGDDAQQPIIIGGLYNGGSIDYLNTFEQGNKEFKLFQRRPGEIVSPYNIPVDKTTGSQGEAKQGLVNTGGKINNQFCVAKYNFDKNPRISIPGHCKDSTDIVSQINKGLIKFIQLMNEIKYINDTYINPTLNKIVDITSEIGAITDIISDALIWLTKYIRDEIIAGVYNLLKNLINQIPLPKELEFLKKAAAGEIADGIWCLFLNILNKIKKFVFDFLFGMIGKVSSVPVCLVESFTGSIIKSVANEIEDAIGPALQQITSTLGQGIGTVMSYVDKAINITKTIASFLQCENSPCKETFDYEMNKGFVPKNGDIKFQNIINYSPAQGLRNLLDDGKTQAEGFLGKISGGDGLPPELQQYFGGCDYSLQCGMPEITFFGGNGSGATGNTVVDAFGQIMGVNITNPGEGYSSSPLISFNDPCNNGAGAYGYARIENGKVKDIVMSDTGLNYLGPETPDPEDLGDDEITNTACSIQPVDSSGSVVYPFIVDVLIENTGIGYTENDVAINSVCPESDVKIKLILDPDGRITGTQITNPGTVVNIFPELTINSVTGYGAILRPVLGFSKTLPELPAGTVTVKNISYCP